MSSKDFDRDSGGFIATGLLSPSPSVASVGPGILPHPRATPLRSDGAKATTLLNMVEGKLRNISARFERRFQNDNASEVENQSPNSGYGNVTDIAKDLDPIVDIIWVSGTPSLQIPFLLNIANAFLDYLEPFPFSPEGTLTLFQKLDYAFSSLLRGEDVQTGERLPGFESGRKVRMTEKVRLRSLVERTRVRIIELAGKRNLNDETDADLTDVTEDEDTEMDEADIDTQTGVRRGHIDLDVARVYQRTLAELSDSLVT